MSEDDPRGTRDRGSGDPATEERSTKARAVGGRIAQADRDDTARTRGGGGKAKKQYARTNLVFYGYSGDTGTPAPKWPSGVDRDKRFQLAAETIATSLQTLYPDDVTIVKQAWSKNLVIAALQVPVPPIREVHICCHGDAGWLSLAMYYDNGKWLRKRAERMDQLSQKTFDDIKVFEEEGLGKASIASEWAIVAGLFSKILKPEQLRAIKKNHGSDASWQIWGCYAGYDSTTLGAGYDDDPVLKRYFRRMNLGATQVDGIAKEIAMTLGVSCTAARGKGGLEFWHAEKKKSVVKVVKNTKKTPAANPHWMWSVAKSEWVTYGASGKELSEPFMLGQSRAASDLGAGAPPEWLTDLYYGKVH